MVIKVYISGMSGSKEVKKRQQRVTMIMDSKSIPYSIVDITEPGQEDEKDFMQKNSLHNGATVSDQTPRHPLPPQIFADGEYCGDYDDFDLANEIDNLEVFLKMEAPKEAPSASEVIAAVDGDDEQEQRELLEAADAMGQREDAAEEQQEDDVEIAEEEEVSSKLVDNDEPMPVEQEQEE